VISRATIIAVRRLAAAVACIAGCGRLGFGMDGSRDGSLSTDAMIGTSTPIDADPSKPNVMFVTSTSIPALSDLATSDAHCAERAAAAGLGGTFVAWLSTSTISASSRLGSARGWVRRDGQPFADEVSELTAGQIFFPPSVDEFGNPSEANARTGTTGAGTYSSTCNNWTNPDLLVGTGLSTSGTEAWTYRNAISCASSAPIYCFQVDGSTASIVITATAGRRAFLSSPWTPGGGLTDADTLCRSDAMAAGLPGMYRALLGTSAASAASRFDDTAATWVRLDGIPLATTAAQFFDGNLIAAPALTTTGQYMAAGVWTGDWPRNVTSTQYTCLDWLSAAATDTGIIGYSADTYLGVFAQGAPPSCSTSYRVYCLER
jgi:hypothetical protein